MPRITKSKLDLDSRKISENSTEVCCRTVDFPETVKAVSKNGANIFIELGANATCTNWIKDILEEETHLAVSINQKGKLDIQSLLEVLAQLTSHGIKMDLSLLFPTNETAQKLRQFLKKILRLLKDW